MIGMHVHQPIPVAGQSPLGQAVQSASTMGLLLLVPPQPQETCPACGHVQSAVGGSAVIVARDSDAHHATQRVLERTIVTTVARI